MNLTHAEVKFCRPGAMANTPSNVDGVTSLTGLVAIKIVPITYDNWKAAPKEQRELKIFDVPQNDFTSALKKMEMRAAAKMWRNFKSELANMYIFGPKEGEDPRQIYPNIDTDQWKSFREQRLTPEALQLRETNIA
ncbi:hypothetical protein QQ045_028839 [Rhodiola kirilowii]